MTEPNREKLVYTRREAAGVARVSLAVLDEALRQGLFKFTRVGRRILIPRNAFLKTLLGE